MAAYEAMSPTAHKIILVAPRIVPTPVGTIRDNSIYHQTWQRNVVLRPALLSWQG